MHLFPTPLHGPNWMAGRAHALSLLRGQDVEYMLLLLRNTYVEWNGTGRKHQRVASAAHTELREAARATHETQLIL